jgi:hypothetical protein
MKLYTVHAEPARPPGIEGWPEPKGPPPVLVKEGFSLGAFLFGPLWFAWNRVWWWALGLLALVLAAAFLLPEGIAGAVILALQLLAGFEGRDAVRARLAKRGLPMQGVVVAPDLDTAWFRLVQQRPDLVKTAP